jgi:hypothetical protein
VLVGKNWQKRKSCIEVSSLPTNPTLSRKIENKAGILHFFLKEFCCGKVKVKTITQIPFLFLNIL